MEKTPKKVLGAPAGIRTRVSGSKEPSFEKEASPRNDSLNWLEIEEQFEQWLQSEDYSEYFKKDVLSYLRRYVTQIREPFDVVSMFSKIKKGKRHLVLALRTLFNFYEAMGISKDYLDYLRKALPKVVAE